MRMKFVNLFLPCILACFFYSYCPAQSTTHTLYIDTVGYTCNSNFNISIRGTNLRNVLALQGTITWDTAVLKYYSVSPGSSVISVGTSNLNLSNANNGYLTFLWYDNNLSPQTMPNDSSLFSINFTRNGGGNGKTDISFSSQPTQLEIDTLDIGGIPTVVTNAIFKSGFIKTPSIYIFIGSGNWSEPSNWVGNILPPAIVPVCSEIIISPILSGECILDVPQIVSPGAKITILGSKRFRIIGNLKIQ